MNDATLNFMQRRLRGVHVEERLQGVRDQVDANLDAEIGQIRARMLEQEQRLEERTEAVLGAMEANVIPAQAALQQIHVGEGVIAEARDTQRRGIALVRKESLRLQVLHRETKALQVQLAGLQEAMKRPQPPGPNMATAYEVASLTIQRFGAGL